MRALPLAIYRAFNGGMPVLMGLYIAHQWGLSKLGAYTVAAASLAVAMVVADWGSARFLPRELSRRDAAAAEVTATNTGVRIVLGLSAVACGLVYAVAGGFDRDVLPFLALLVPVVFASVAATNAVSSRIVDDDLTGLIAAVAAGTAPVALTAAIVGKAEGGALLVVAAYAAGKWLETLLLTRGRWKVQRVSFHHARRVFVMMMPFGLSAIAATVYSRLPIFALETWGTRAELGIISVGSALQNVLLLVPTATALMVYPRLAVALSQRDGEGLRGSLAGYLFSSALVLSVGLAAFWIARELVCRVLDVPASAATFLFLYVSIACLSTINAIGGATLQAAGAEKRVALWGAGVLALAIPLQFLLARAWGMWGVLTAIAVCEVLSSILYSIDAWRTSRRVIAGQAPGARATTTT